MHPGILISIIAIVVFRLAGPLAGPEVANVVANFSPLAAIMVAGAIYLPRRAAFAVPFGALFVSTVLVNWVKGFPLLDAYILGSVAGFVLLFGLGWLARGTRSVGVVFGTAVAGTLLFYLFTNTISFFFEPGYAKTPGGWLQALTTGLPQYPPTYWFLVKSLAADILFTALLVLACHPFAWRARHSPAPVSPAVA